MIILGVDPGIASVGYGVVRYVGNQFSPITYATFHTAAGLPLPVRLRQIYEFLLETIDKYHIDAMAVEELFFNTNVKTAITVGHGRGVVLLAGSMSGVQVFEYTPLQVKQAVVGYGRADKNQVQQMVKIMLNLKSIPKPDDTADALALAICHAHCSSSQLPII
ncbi:MAG: crossover junction endodeoxyribonuclease RuvC [Bacillota bacterium]|nr:crossover junction endodeoxyribonuclease RuvC [Bacillota bacterium]